MGKIAGLSLLLGLVLNASPAAYAQAAQGSTKAATKETTAPQQVRQGLPGRRTAAATRNADGPTLIVLAPEETPWLSQSEEPSLLVYIASAILFRT